MGDDMIDKIIDRNSYISSFIFIITLKMSSLTDKIVLALTLYLSSPLNHE